MLAIMSILGVFVLMMSTTEVQISGNYSAGQQALAAADRTLEAGEALLTNIGSVNLDTQTVQVDEENSALLVNVLRDAVSGPVPNGGNQVTLLRSGPAAGYGADFQGNYYAITAVGGAVFDNSDVPRVRARLESQRVNVSFTGGSSSTQFVTTGADYVED